MLSTFSLSLSLSLPGFKKREKRRWDMNLRKCFVVSFGFGLDAGVGCVWLVLYYETLACKV